MESENILPFTKEEKKYSLLGALKTPFQMNVRFAFHVESSVPQSEGRVENYRVHFA